MEITLLIYRKFRMNSCADIDFKYALVNKAIKMIEIIF